MYIGIDLGTSGVKAVLIDASQRIIGSATSSLSVSRPRTGWSEQDPESWTSAADAAMSELSANHRREVSAVKGIGLSGQMHGATFLDSANNVLRPAILWNDTRSHAEAAALDADPQFRKITGNIVFPGFTAPKANWLRVNEPEIFSRVRRVLLPKDYLRLWLTGEHVSEMSDAAGTSWLDTENRRWSGELLAATGLEEKHMPRLVEGTEPSAILRTDLAAKWSMRENVLVAGGAGDNAASACGMGTVAAGSAFLSLGTSGVLFAANDSYRPNAESAVHTFCHALPGTWHQMGVILSATDSLNWLAGICSQSAAKLTDALGQSLKKPGTARFLPYLSGERTPHNDARIRGVFCGLEHETGTAGLTQAVLEGVAFAFRDCQEALRQAGTELHAVTAIGGGSRSRYWLELMATVLRIPVEKPADGDFGAAFGAARIGLIAAEGADPFSILTPPATEYVVEPDTSLSSAFEDAYCNFKETYSALRPLSA
jgi:xylulokinase